MSHKSAIKMEITFRPNEWKHSIIHLYWPQLGHQSTSFCPTFTMETPETQRRWSTSTLPSGSLSPVLGKPCPLSPSEPVRRWWQLPWSHPGLLQRQRSRASHWEPSWPVKNGWKMLEIPLKNSYKKWLMTCTTIFCLLWRTSLTRGRTKMLSEEP